jgi:hypothetical protein
MSYVFGGATGDDFNFATSGTLGGDNNIGLVCGWWYPTTLTATRKLWSCNTTGILGAEIDATTSSLRLKTDNTTDGQWTVPVGFAVDQWFFLAFLLATENTGVLAAWRVWVGTSDTPPTAATVTVATNPVGNFSGSGSFYIGNAGTGTLAFQGNIANIVWLSQTTSVQQPSPLGIATSGVIAADEELRIYNNLVRPMWSGDYSNIWQQLNTPLGSAHARWLIPMRSVGGTPPGYGGLTTGIPSGFGVNCTGTGPAYSLIDSPRPILNVMHDNAPRRR